MLPLDLPQAYNPTKLTLKVVEEIVEFLEAFLFLPLDAVCKVKDNPTPTFPNQLLA
jgi:hypothetical protein